MFVHNSNVIRKIRTLAACIYLVFTMSISAFADETAAEIKVTCSDPCMVGLTGVSENTEGFTEVRACSDNAVFSVALTEPGQYEYELKQVAAGQYDIYDDTVYQVFINMLYEDNRMVSVVTGGLKGTEEKSEEFRFEGLQEIPPKKEDPGPEPEETTREKPAAAKADKTKAKEKTGHKITSGDAVPMTGDSTNIAIWICLMCLSAAGIITFSYLGYRKKNQRETRYQVTEAEEKNG